MRVVDQVELSCTAAEAMAVLGDLGRYPDWLDIVHRSTPAAPDVGDPGAAWMVDLRASVGPLARSKRLRMTRAAHVVDESVRFERRELDGREHSPWMLTAEVSPGASGVVVHMTLEYGGGLLDGLVERLLRREIDAAKDRLRALV